MTRLRATQYKACPSSFNGTAGEFFETFCRPNLIPIEEMRKIHSELCAYANDASAILFLREVRGLDRSRKIGVVRDGIEVGGRLIAGTDNSPAWVLHSIARSALTPSGPEFVAWMKEYLPCHMFAIKKVLDNTMNEANWHAAHIVDAKDGNTSYQTWDGDEVRRRFLRSVHPINIALAPKEKGKQTIGGDKGFLGFCIAQIRSIYGSLWDEFVAELRQPFNEHQAWDASHPLSFGLSPSQDEPRSQSPIHDSRDTRISGSKSSKAATFTLNISDSRQHYFRHVPWPRDSSLYTIDFSWVAEAGSAKNRVGVFTIDIEDMLRRGILLKTRDGSQVMVAIWFENGRFILKSRKEFNGLQLGQIENAA